MPLNGKTPVIGVSIMAPVTGQERSLEESRYARPKMAVL